MTGYLTSLLTRSQPNSVFREGLFTYSCISLAILESVLPKLTVSQRKACLTCCRVQQAFEDNPRLNDLVDIAFPLGTYFIDVDHLLRRSSRPNLESNFQRRMDAYCKQMKLFAKAKASNDRNTRLRAVLPRKPTQPPRLRTITRHDIKAALNKIMRSPILSSILSMLLRTAPFDDWTDIKNALKASIFKEVSASRSDDIQPANYDYSVIFGGRYDSQLHESLPLRPSLALKINSRFRMLCQKMEGMLTFPSLSEKSVSRDTARHYRQIKPHSQASEYFNVSTSDLAMLYEETGIVVEGPCEVRVAFKYNDLGPRVYFALGGDAFASSMFVQPIFIVLLDLLKSSSPSTRMNIYRIQHQKSEELSRWFMLHDYTSFTSKMRESRNFGYALAEYMKDTFTWVFDPRDGIQNINVGELLFKYTKDNLDHPIFSLERIHPKGEREYLDHISGGMLGVYGNIAICTLLHAIALVFISGDEDCNTCVGDDGAHENDPVTDIHGLPMITLHDTKRALQTLGDINDLKFIIIMFSMARVSQLITPPGWHFTKRPFNVIGSSIIMGLLFDIPILSMLFPKDMDDPHTTRPAERPEEQAFLFLTQVSRLMTRLPSVGFSSDEDIDTLLSLLSAVYSYLDLPHDGSLAPHKGGYEVLETCPLAVPPLVPEVFTEDWLQILHDRSTNDQLIIPDRYHEGREDIYRGRLSELLPDSVVLVRRPFASGYLRKMKYIHLAQVYCTVPFTMENWQVYLEYVRSRVGAEYNLYTVSILRRFHRDWSRIEESVEEYQIVDYDSDEETGFSE